MSRVHWFHVSALLCALVLSGGCTPESEIVRVDVDPSSAVLGSGEELVFSATVSGAAPERVEWSATAGMIVPGGASARFVAPVSPGDVIVRAAVPGTSAVGSATVTVEVEPVTSEATSDESGVADFGGSGVRVSLTDAATSRAISGVHVRLLEFPSHTIIEARSSDGSYLPAFGSIARARGSGADGVQTSLLTGTTVTMVPRSSEPPPYWVYLALPPQVWYSLIYQAAFCGEASLRDLSEELEVQASGIRSPWEVELVIAALPFDLGLNMVDPGEVMYAGLGSGFGEVQRSELAGGLIVGLALAAWSVFEWQAASVNNRIVNGYLETYDPDQRVRYCTTPTGGILYVTIHPLDPPPGGTPDPDRLELTQTPGSFDVSLLRGESASASFELENTGTLDVRVVSIESSAGWVSVSPASVGRIEPGQRASIDVVVDSASLVPGTHFAEVTTAWAPAGGGTVGSATFSVSVEVTGADCPTCRRFFSWTIGTHNYEVTDTLETVMYLWVGDPEPPSSVTVTVTGPAGYRISRTFDTTHLRVGCFYVSPWVEPLLPSGTYTAVTRIGGVDYSIPIAYSATRVLATPVVILDDATATAVSVTINRVAGAASYSVVLYEVEVGNARGIGIEHTEVAAEASPSQSVTLDGLTLSTNRSYYLDVWASSVLDPWRVPLVPQQVDMSITRTAPFTPR